MGSMAKEDWIAERKSEQMQAQSLKVSKQIANKSKK